MAKGEGGKESNEQGTNQACQGGRWRTDRQPEKREKVVVGERQERRAPPIIKLHQRKRNRSSFGYVVWQSTSTESGLIM